MNKVLKNLSGGDLRSEGRAEEVAGEIVNHPHLLMELAEGLQSDSKLIRGRTCMTMEVVSRSHPDILLDVVQQLIELASKDNVSQVRWHVAEIFGNVTLSDREAERVISILLGYLGDKSKIVNYCAVQTLGVLGRGSRSKEEIVNGIRALKDVSKSLTTAVTESMRNLGVD